MYGVDKIQAETAELPALTLERWYAVQTRARHEKRVATELSQKGITAYLPIVNEIHRWSDRRKTVEVPLFSNYAFVRAVLSPETRISILRATGVLNFVGPQNVPAPIPDSEIDGVRALIASHLQFAPYPFLKTGQRVVIRGGALDGVEGMFVRQDNSRRLVISVGAIQQSLAISIEGYDIEPV